MTNSVRTYAYSIGQSLDAVFRFTVKEDKTIIAKCKSKGEAAMIVAALERMHGVQQ